MAYAIFQAMTAARSAAAQFGADGSGGGASAAGVGGLPYAAVVLGLPGAEVFRYVGS